MTIAYFFCDQPKSVHRHIEEWHSFSKEIKSQLEFVLVDTGSKELVNIDKRDLNLSLYKIKNFIPWNYGARNLIYLVSSSRWVFHSDLDHIVNQQSAQELIRLEKNPQSFYMFKRKNKSLKNDHHYNTTIHPATILVTREAFWIAGGIEENLSGHYGYDDTILVESLQRKGYKKEVPENITIENLSLSGDDQDEDFINGGTWSRDISRNQEIYNQFKSGNMELSLNRLNFEWEKII